MCLSIVKALINTKGKAKNIEYEIGYIYFLIIGLSIYFNVIGFLIFVIMYQLNIQYFYLYRYGKLENGEK